MLDHVTPILAAAAVAVVLALMLFRGRVRPVAARGTAAERARARRLNIADDAIDRFVAAYKEKGLTEFEALRKMNDDLVRDRAGYRP